MSQEHVILAAKARKNRPRLNKTVISENDMENLSREEETLPEIPDWVPASHRLSAIAVIRTITEHELFGDQGGYPPIGELFCFMHEGRRTAPEIHGDNFPEQLYRLDGCFAVECREA